MGLHCLKQLCLLSGCEPVRVRVRERGVRWRLTEHGVHVRTARVHAAMRLCSWCTAQRAACNGRHKAAAVG